ncbi:MAG: cyclic 3',5'-adenosine monophosphate phosphodiesterase [Firmicutes bacterium ADurb.Bin182]|nr:MAG: cyclic 3',5'-adenosine monophosphate phosphodiesterase [Firmicutes bacterium ADurb.Bin182]
MRKKLLYLLIFTLFISGCAGKTPCGPKDTDPLPLVPMYEPDPLNAENGVYTLCWMTDTQYYSKYYPWIFHSMTLFLKNNTQRMNLKYIFHTGDIVNSKNDDNQWNTAEKCLSQIEHIPMSILAGNHDVAYDSLDYSDFSERFGKNYTEGKSWIGGLYENNRGHYALVELGSTEYLFVSMGYGTDKKCIEWMNGVFKKYPERAGFLLLHEYINTNGTFTDNGESIFNEVVKNNPNIYMVLCGHRYNANMRIDEFDDDKDGSPDRSVCQMLANYQNNSWGGAGYMRFFRVDEQKKEISVLTYSPYKDDYNYFDPDEFPGKDEFTLEAEWLGPARPDSD